MNEAVFIKGFNEDDTEAMRIIHHINNRISMVRDKIRIIEMEVGQLEINNDGIKLIASEEKFIDAFEEVNTSLKAIWDDYRKLNGLGIVEICQAHDEQN